MSYDHDLDTQILLRYGKDVPAYQKRNFYVKGFKSYSLNRHTHTDTQTWLKTLPTHVLKMFHWGLLYPWGSPFSRKFGVGGSTPCKFSMRNSFSREGEGRGRLSKFFVTSYISRMGNGECNTNFRRRGRTSLTPIRAETGASFFVGRQALQFCVKSDFSNLCWTFILTPNRLILLSMNFTKQALWCYTWSRISQ